MLSTFDLSFAECRNVPYKSHWPHSDGWGTAADSPSRPLSTGTFCVYMVDSQPAA